MIYWVLYQYGLNTIAQYLEHATWLEIRVRYVTDALENCVSSHDSYDNSLDFLKKEILEGEKIRLDWRFQEDNISLFNLLSFCLFPL